ncbi:MAG: tetratricopeptide repeat protein [Myxococcota bacterium]|nr:tetratricopeptide repeat protein [Myxococcota bacterium]
MQLGALRTAQSLVAVGLLAVTSGCVTVAEFRKLEDRVIRIERGGSDEGAREAVANAAAEIDLLRREIGELRGRLEVTEKLATDARVDARKARQKLADQSAVASPVTPSQEPLLSEEVRAYRDAYAVWRSGDHQQCVDKFGSFLQSYPESAEADDAMFWMADCLFKSGDFKYAVLRFDDVVNKYPDGDKAPDALFRQGEALLELGPSFQPAAIKAFERLLSEYPNSALVDQARRRLQVARAG